MYTVCMDTWYYHPKMYIYIYICIEWENKCYLLTTNWDAQLSTIGGNKNWTHCKSTASSRPVIKWLWAESVNRPGFGVYSHNLVPSVATWFPQCILTPTMLHAYIIYVLKDMYLNIYIYTHILYIYIHLHIYIYLCKYKYMYVYVYIYM